MKTNDIQPLGIVVVSYDVHARNWPLFSAVPDRLLHVSRCILRHAKNRVEAVESALINERCMSNNACVGNGLWLLHRIQLDAAMGKVLFVHCTHFSRRVIAVRHRCVCIS